MKREDLGEPARHDVLRSRALDICDQLAWSSHSETFQVPASAYRMATRAMTTWRSSKANTNWFQPGLQPTFAVTNFYNSPYYFYLK